MVEDFDTLDVRQRADDERGDVICKINSTFWKLLGVEFWLDELQCLTQQELISFLQSSENLKKLYYAWIIDINTNDSEDKIKDSLRMYVKYIKPVIEKYWTNDELFDSILYVNDLFVSSPRYKIEIEDLPEVMDFFSKHIINKDRFDICINLSKYRHFAPMNIRYIVMAVENYLDRKKWKIPLEVNYKEIERESYLLNFLI